jgi:glycosyltransferase involved in cell wall biosynthesis
MIYLLFLIFSCFTSLCAVSETSSSPRQLRINLISQRNGKGLEADQDILKEALEKLGCLVNNIDFEEAKWSKADINVFFQILIPAKFPWAPLNWFIPNPEWYQQDIKLLEKIDLILCRTRETERIFRNLGKQVYYLGFTSHDCYQETIQKNYSHLFHLAGGSLLKGTSAIQNIWHSHPHFPLLTVVKYPSDFIFSQSNLKWIPHRLPLNQLRLLQNECGIHLCPSETEGFGHYIIEGMSTGAVVVTTDAPPMNEFITDHRCLVPYAQKAPSYLATNYSVDAKELQNKIEYLIHLPRKELQAIGRKNRMMYSQKKQEFYEQLKELIDIASSLVELSKKGF